MNNCSTVTSIQEIFENQVSINPHNTAITGFSYSTGSQIDLSYDELNRKSNQLAHILIKKGVTTDTVVGILLDRSIELVISILAILKSGAAYLPLAPGYPEEKITSIINNSRLSLILTAREIDRNKPGTETIFVDNPAGNREQEENPCAPSSPESLAYVLYTSGSTGEPRGVMIEQGSVINRLSWMQKKWPLGREDSILVKSAVTFDVLTMEIFCGLLYGARLYILEKDGEREPFTLLKAIKNEKITYIHLVPSLLNVLLDYIQDHIENHIDLASGLKRVSVGGEELPASVAKKFKKVLYKKNGTTLHNLYGQTETTIDVTSYDIDFDTPLDTSGNSIPIGKPIDNIKIYIIDKNNNKISPGDKGELCISGMGLARGYLANPEQTREKFIPNPFSHESPEHQTLYKTGDIVRELRGGNIEFLGRKDNQVKIHGYRIELEEIEAVLAGFETVREAVVTAGNHEHLCAYISGKAAKEEIKSYLAKKIPRYMIPSYYVFLEAFPRLSNGKINRKALPAPGPKIAAAGGAYSPPSNETEKKLQTIWTGILKVKKISVDDNLFDIGSNSLQAMIAALQIRKIFDIETEIKDIFKNPTIQKLAARISHLKTGPSPKKNHTVPVQRAPQQEYYPLSSAQKRIYFLQQLEPGSTHYNIASLTRIEGDIDRARLESAFRKIIERHESLRTGFEIVNNQPVQKIHDTSIINNIDNTLINYIDCTKNVDEYIKQGVKPFNPAKPPLIRFTVMRTNHAGMEPVHFLLIDMHHIISDGLSIEILKKEISCIYNGQPLEKIYLQYKDYAVWQNLLSNPANKGWNETCREYWVNRLSGEIPVLPLPVDYPRPSVQSFEGQNLEFITGNHLTQKLKQVAHQNNSTLYMLLLAAYAVLLYKYTGQEDIIVGCPVANRTDADLFPIVGMFVNTLPLRNYPKGKKKFNNFLREVTEQTLNDFKHQDYQLEELVANLEIERDPARNPLFDTVLLLHNMDKEVIHLDNTPAAPCRLARNTSRFDLKPEAMETEGRLSWNVEYCTKLYKKETIETLFSHFSNILYSLAENRGNISIAAVNILSLPEKKQLVTPAALNNNTDYTKYRTIHQLFEEQAKRSPGAPALRFENITMTYGELNDRANALAGFLIEKGAAAESIVGLLTDRSPEMITGILAILKAGGAYLPIDTESPHNRTAYLLQNSGAKILLTQKKYISKTFDAVENIDINVDINIDSTQCPNPGTKARENNLAYVIHTSGTTGKPKGVMIEHAQLINYTLSVLKRIALPWSSHFALVSPVFADLGNTMIFGALCSGGCLHVISKERSLNPVTMAEYFANNAIDCLKIVPSHLKALALNRDIQELLPRKLLILGGEASKTGWVREIQKAASDLRIMNHFGPSEAAIGITSYEATKTTFRDFPDQLPLGSPLDNNCLYILDKDMQPVPPGITGEIYLGGKNIARGYINRQDLTTESFVPNPFNTTDLHKEYARLYKTGDLAVRLSNGNFLFKGRKDDQVKISGYRVELPEIKSILNTHPLINNSVIVLSGKNGSKKLAAYVVLEPGKNIDHMARELRDFLSSTLPPYMIPGFFISIENIPLNKNGKVDRKALPEPGGIEDPEESNPPAPGMETRLAKIWSRVLEVQEKTVSRNSNFFDHGSSLKAIILVSAIHKEMNIEIPVIELFKKPLLKDIARFMRGAEKNHFKAIEPVPVLSAGKAVYPLSSAQKRMFVLYRMQKESINYNRTILFKIEGKAGREIDIQRLEKTFQQLIERYEIFRTGFDICENEAVQKIYLPHEMSSFSINYPDSIQDSIQDFIQPFDLSAPPLLRAVLVKSPDPHSYLLMIDSHHIITDGTSIRIVLKEFSDIYNGSTVPEIRIQYKDYAIWQKELFQTEGFKKQEQFWLETFQGELPVLDFPTDFPRPAVMSLEGSLLHFTIDTKITRPLLELAKENKATLFMVLFAAYSILLYRYTGQDDIVVGTGIANRAHADLQDMPGMFVNTLALRNSIDDSKSFPEFLQGVKNNVLQAYENQDYQFEELVEKLEPVRDTGRNPLFDTVFILQNIEKPALTLEGLKTESVPQACDTSKFDITVETREQNGAIEGKIEYCTKLFREETIRRFAEHFTHVLQEITAVPDRKIEDIYILSSNEKKQLLNDFNPQETPYSSNTTIHQIFEEQVKKTPGNTAAIFENKRVSYEELNNRSNQLARVLREKGIKPDTVAGIMVHRSLDMILGIMAILKAGGAYLPISPDYPQDRIRFMLEESEAQIVLTTKNEGDNFIEQTLPGGILYLDKPEWLDRSTENLPGINSPGNLAYVIYTSGSTGKPKGVMIEHHSLINRIEWMQKQYPITEQDTILQKTPYTFDVSVWELFWWAFQGARVSFLVPGGEKDPAEIIRAIEKNNITIMHFVPSMLNTFLEYLKNVSSGHNRKKIASLRQVFASGEALTPTQVRLFEELLYNPAGTLLANLYGPTEAAIDVSYFDCFPGNNPDRIPIGKPVDNTTLYVLGAKNELQPVGIAGELYISGVQLARGYINRPGLTAEKFVENPYSPGEKMYKTGDIARWLPNGNIEYLGRTDHQVKIRGFRIELGEIEHHLTSHPALRDAVVQAEGDEADRQLVSYCIPRSPGAYPVLQMLKMKKEDTVKDKKTCELPNGLNIFYLNKNETEFMYNDIFEERCYAQGGITLDDGSVIFDVGANIGLFSLFAHHVCGDARFFAFEPVPAICDVLRLNTELYGVNASIHPIGLGDSSGEATFTYYPNISIMSGRFAKLDEEKKAVKAFLLNSADTENAVTGENQLEEMIQARLVSQEFTCPIKTISEVIRENNIERIDLLKIDVEKSEVSVLKGIDDEDWKKIRQVVLEVHEINGELDWISGTLESHGFRISVDQEEQLTDTGFFNVYAVSEQVLSGSNTAREIPPVSINTLNSPGQLIEHIKKNLKNKLPHYMTPSRFMLMESFPLTASGKLNRTKLKETAFDFSDMAMEYSPPETKTEIQLVEIWKELLAIKKIGITQNFFDLGGHSLKATIMITRIHKEMNVDLPLIRVFTNPTIKMLAAEINSLSQSIYASIEPAPVQDYYPLSSAQKRMFILRQYDEKGTAYNSTSIFKIKGEPDRERLEKVFSRLIERHQPLRTGFKILNGEPVQIIEEQCGFSLEYEESGNAPEAVIESFIQPFDLQKPPLIRVKLVKNTGHLSAQFAGFQYLLLIDIHHILIDGTSLEILLKEISMLYEGKEPAPLRLQYIDYVQWHRKMMKDNESFRKQEAY